MPVQKAVVGTTLAFPAGVETRRPRSPIASLFIGAIGVVRSLTAPFTTRSFPHAED